MSWPEVQDLPARTDVVIIALGALEQHGPQLPAGTDYLSAGERAKLIAQKTEVLVAPILLPGLSPYRMEFPGTISLSHETLQRVYLEAVQSLVRQGFRRILFLNSHVGNQHLCVPGSAFSCHRETFSFPNSRKNGFNPSKTAFFTSGPRKQQSSSAL